MQTKKCYFQDNQRRAKSTTIKGFQDKVALNDQLILMLNAFSNESE